MKINIITLFFALLLLSSCQNAAKETSTTNTTAAATTVVVEKAKLLPVADFMAEMAKMDKKDYYLIDVRTKDEFEFGALPDALNIDFEAADFEAQLAKLDKNKVAFLYCQGGGRSASACKVAEKVAFKAIFDMQGGYSTWKKSQ